MKTKFLKLFLISIIFFNIVSFAKAATYYVCDNATSCNSSNGFVIAGSGWSTGNNNNNCTSKTTPCLTITSGISKMTGGDMLIVGNGAYVAQPLTAMPSGSLGAYTILKSENVGGAIVDMSGVTVAWSDAGINMYSQQYVQLEGFKIRGNINNSSDNSGGPIIVSGNYNKLIRISAYDAPSTGNIAVFNIGGDHNLLEECWTWGTGRYKFLIYHATNTTIRRCVARHDYHGGNNSWSHQEANFTNYDSTNSLFQNCIAIDSGIEGNTEEIIYGGFWDENNNSTISKTGKIIGSIVLNMNTDFAGMLDKVSGTRTIDNNVIWDSSGGYVTNFGSASIGTFGAISNVANMTIGALNGNYDGTYNAKGVAAGSPFNMTAVTANSILYGANSYGIDGFMTSHNNILYENTNNYGHGAIAGTGDINNINPFENGLEYLPRIENGSYLKTAGEDGTQIGAEIMYQYGISGSLYGETGYDTLTNISLWPFPNENLIKADFASYTGPGPVGERGFATGNSINGAPQTLTKYIWEYLGNQIPCEIYETCNSDQIAPNIPTGLSVI